LPEKPLILIIDDEEALCALLSTMLTTKNVRVQSVHSIADADSYFKEGLSPAVVFLDHLLPDGLGLEYLKRIKTIDRKIKVIIISGSDDEKLMNEAIAHGCFAFLEKPFSYLRVSELVDKALDKKVTFWFRKS